MKSMRRLLGQLMMVLALCLLAQRISATSEIAPEIDLLEFLGTIAGLESMGVDIDELLAGSETDDDVETDDASEVNKGEHND